MAYFLKEIFIAVAISLCASGIKKLIFTTEKDVAILVHSFKKRAHMGHQYPNVRACVDEKCSKIS
jgi:hypothetical protein